MLLRNPASGMIFIFATLETEATAASSEMILLKKEPYMIDEPTLVQNSCVFYMNFCAFYLLHQNKLPKVSN